MLEQLMSIIRRGALKSLACVLASGCVTLTAFAQPDSRNAGVRPRVFRPPVEIAVPEAQVQRVDPARITGQNAVSVTLQIDSVSPADALGGQDVRVGYTISNLSVAVVLSGIMSGDFSGRPLLDSSGVRTVAISLAPGAKASGVLTLPKAEPRIGLVQLRFTDARNCRDSNVLNPAGKPIQTCETFASATASQSLQIDRDDDQDLLSDAVERRMLARFRPYYFFSNDGGVEEYPPADALAYIRKSRLLADANENGRAIVGNDILRATPEAVLFGQSPPNSSNLSVRPWQSDYHIDADDDAGRSPNTWPQERAAKNIGLYGHVVPIHLNAPNDFRFGQSISTGKLYYKIEYWQFFGFNDAKQSRIGNHEGDWASVQLIYDPAYDKIISVFHFAHGMSFRYDLYPQGDLHTVIANVKGVLVKEYRGAANYFRGNDHFTANLDLTRLDLGVSPPKLRVNDDQLALAQNNILRFAKGDETSEYEHPVVFVETNSHEFFPSEFWKVYASPNHNGDGEHFLTAAPPNLGEIDHPLAETPAGRIIVQFNGLWGAYGYFNDPPPGPPLHLNWTRVSGAASEKALSELKLGF